MSVFGSTLCVVVLIGMYLFKTHSVHAGMPHDPRFVFDPYKVLGLRPGATQSAIRSAFIMLAKKSHPDKNLSGSEDGEYFKCVRRAYEVLMDQSITKSESNSDQSTNRDMCPDYQGMFFHFE